MRVKRRKLVRVVDDWRFLSYLLLMLMHVKPYTIFNVLLDLYNWSHSFYIQIVRRQVCLHGICSYLRPLLEVIVFRTNDLCRSIGPMPSWFMSSAWSVPEPSMLLDLSSCERCNTVGCSAMPNAHASGISVPMSSPIADDCAKYFCVRLYFPKFMPTEPKSHCHLAGTSYSRTAPCSPPDLSRRLQVSASPPTSPLRSRESYCSDDQTP